jgi:hypothetical protein
MRVLTVHLLFDQSRHMIVLLSPYIVQGLPLGWNIPRPDVST